MRSRFFSIGVVVVALAAFAASASAGTIIYDNFDGTTLDSSKWYADTGAGFNVPTVSGGAVHINNVTATADINSVEKWMVGTTLEFKLNSAPIGAGCFGYGVGSGGNSACLRNDQPGGAWQFVVDDNSGVNIYRSGDLFNSGTPGAGKLYSFVWNADSMALLENGVQLAVATGRSLSGSWGAFAYAGNAMSWDYVATSTVPEPTAFVLVATGIFGLLAYAWRKRC